MVFPADSAKARVVVADDDIDTADMLRLLLELEGHEVHAAYGGESALSLVRTHRPQVVVLDLGMPDRGGLEVARTLRDEGLSPVLVALTGRSDEDIRSTARDAGFAYHLVKPIEPESLRSLVRSLGR